MKSSIRKSLPLISLIISLAAIVLSQIRPLYTLLDKPEIDFILPRRLQVDHYYGFWRLSSFCQIRNGGHATGRVKKLEGMLTRPPQYEFRQHLVADFYTDPNPGTPARGRTLPVNNVVLKPDETWDKRITFQPPYPQGDENKIMRFRREVLSGNTAVADMLTSWVLERGDQIKIGDYCLLIVVRLDTDQTVAHAFSFHLDQDNVDTLRADMNSIVDRITEKQKPISMFVDLTDMTDPAALAALNRVWKSLVVQNTDG